MNSVTLIGRITKDLELRKTNNGSSVLEFTLAVNRRSKDDGADFITCQAWKNTAETMSKYLHKGSLIGVKGRIQTSNYDGKNGKVYRTDVVVDEFEFLEKKSEPTEEPKYEPQVDVENYEQIDLSPDDLPFY